MSIGSAFNGGGADTGTYFFMKYGKPKKHTHTRTRTHAHTQTTAIFSFATTRRPGLSSISMDLGLTQPLTGVSTRNLPWGKEQPAGTYGRYYNCHLLADCLDNVEALTSHKPTSLLACYTDRRLLL
jgi:hypothetical protein